MALFSTPPVLPYHLLSGTDPIALLGDYGAEELPHLLGSDDGSSDLIPDIRRIGSRQWLLTHGAIAQAGNYRLQANDADVPTEGLSFNYSRQESVMDFYTSNEVKRLVDNMHLSNCSVATSAQKSMTDYIQQRHQGKPLWRLFLLLALAALLAEILLLRLKNKR
jgi:hypothetical protein